MMDDKNCKKCVYAEEQLSGSIKCEYPVPAYIQIRSNNYLNGIEARECSLYKTKKDLALEAIK